jgi:hypothetical protein
MTDENKTKELSLTGDYVWKLTGKGMALPADEGEPNALISEWEIVIADNGIDDDVKDAAQPALENVEDVEGVVLGKIVFRVVNQTAAYNRGEDLFEVYDSEDEFHLNYYEHVKERDESEGLLIAGNVILLTEDDLAAFQQVRRFDVLQILSEIFAEVVIAIWCKDQNSEVAVHLATAMDELPRLPADDSKEVWLYHDSRYEWLVETVVPVT